MNPDGENLVPLLTAMLDGQMSDADQGRLADLLRGDPVAQEKYIDLCWTHALLRQELGAYAEVPSTCGSLPAGAVQPGESLPVVFVDSATEPSASPFSLSSTLGGMIFSYGVSAMIVTAMLIGAWAYKISIIQECNNSVANVTVPNEHVGRITGMKDCHWTDPADAPFVGSFIRLDRRFELDAGLLEITYTTGAKVILEGPCVYEVNSTAGGYLGRGKLTARIEKRGARREERGEKSGGLAASAASAKPQAANPQPPTPNPHPPISLFAVTTPTATITDLGTEFGVEVSERGDVTTQVFEGAVELEVLGGARRQGQTIRINVGELIRLEKGADGQGPTVLRSVADAAFFAVRPGHLAEFAERQKLKSFRRWQAFSESLRKRHDLVAYYDFQQDEKNKYKLRNRASTDRRLDGWINGAGWVSGRFPGKHALYFRGHGHDDRVVLPEQERFQFAGPFSIAVWFKVDQFEGKWLALAAKGDTSWRLQQHGDANAISFGVSLNFGPDRQTTTTAGHTEVADDRWHFAVAVYEPGDDATHARLYLDGRLEAESRLPQSVFLCQNDEPVWLGDNSMRLEPSREFQGLIDEAAFFAAALSADEVAAMFQASAPDHPPADGERR